MSIASPLSKTIEPELTKIHRTVYAAISSLADDLGIFYGAADIPPARSPKPAVILVLTGGTERKILAVAEKGWMPAALLAHRSYNSLPATLEVLAGLRKYGYNPVVKYLRSNRDAEIELPKLVEMLSSIYSAIGFRVGLIGGLSEWLVASNINRARLREKLLGEILDIEMDELVQRAKSCDTNTRHVVQKVSEKCLLHVPRDNLVSALRVYCALRSIVEEYMLDAVTLRCFDLIKDLGTTGCLALALLNSEGVVGGCEGDLQSTVTMLLAKRIAGSDVWMANPVDIDEEDNTVVLAHCTAPLSVGGRCRLTTHFESGIGVGVDVAFREMPVTLLRVSENLDQLFLLRGIIIESGMGRDDICRTQVKIKVIDDSVRKILDKGLGNHLVLSLGDHAELYRLFARLFDLDII